MKNIIKILTFALLISVSMSINLICSLCHEIVTAIQHAPPQKPIDNFLEKIATAICVKKNIQDKTVCNGAVGEMTKYILNSVWRHYTDPHLVCHRLYMCPKEYTYRVLSQDIAKIVEGRPDKQWEKPTKTKILNVLHISDLHPDLYYTVGAPYKCSQPLCCRTNVTKNTNLYELFQKYENEDFLVASQNTTETPAGYWGSLGSCDLPFQTFDLFLKQISKMNLDLIIWTGDNTPHDIWQQSQDYNINFTNILAKRIRQYTNVTVVAAMGNHESWPVNVYDYQGDRETMLNQGLAEIWRPWLTEEAYKMQRQKGYYSIELPKLNNLKIISINTQAGNDDNWFLLRDPTDPGKMLDWIQKQLKESQAKGQFVYLIGHIPPKTNLNEWAMRFYALVYRYSYIIRGQFYGHTHRDHLSFYPDMKKPEELSNYYLVAPSLTTFSNKDPQYRVMKVDFDTLQVINYYQYQLHLQKYTKKEQDAHFQLLYNFLDAYGLQDMTVKGGMTKFKNMLKNDPQVQKKFNHYRGGGLTPGKSGLDIYCETTVTPQFQAECMNKKYTEGKFQKYAGKWKDLKHTLVEQ